MTEPLVHGDVADGYGPVADVFWENFVKRKELGAAMCVVRDGEVVVDLWGGHRDKLRTQPWERNTLVTVFSTTKGMASAAMALAHSRGLFDLEQQVAAYWPEFGQAGKESITVRQLLEHEAGLPVIDVALDIDTIADFDKFGAILAAQSPKWTPGEGQGYHAQSLGWYENQIMRRVDPAGRSIGQFFADEIAKPLGVEFYIGLPETVEEDRLATFVGGNKLALLLHTHEVPWPVLRNMLNPFSMTFKAFTNPKAITKLSDINTRRLLEVELPSVNGTGTAKALATVYEELATGGKRLGMNAETLAELEKPKAPAMDKIFGLEAAFRFGLMKQFPILSYGSSPRAYGHSGSGGSFAFADPDTGTGYAYVMNRAGYTLPTDDREVAVRSAYEACAG